MKMEKKLVTESLQMIRALDKIEEKRDQCKKQVKLLKGTRLDYLGQSSVSSGFIKVSDRPCVRQ